MTAGTTGPRTPAEYQPGVCNIGPAEIRRRRMVGHVGLAGSLGLLAMIVAQHRRASDQAQLNRNRAPMFVRLPLRLDALRVAAPSLALLLALGACGDREPTPQASDLSDAERIYLADVSAALRLFDERNDEFDRALSQTYRTNEALFSALEGAGAGTAFEPGLEAVEALHPPPRFSDDHELLLDRQRNLVLLDRDIGMAIAEADLDRFMLLNMQLGLTSDLAALELEPAVCETVLRNGLANHETQSAEYLASVFCDRSELPGDGYGDRVRDALRGATIEISLRGQALDFFALVPVVSDDALLEVGSQAFTGIVQVTKSASRQIRALEPPERMAGDHQRLLEYLDDVERIIDEAVREALEGDVEAFEPDDFAELYCRTREDIGLAYRPIVRVHFSDIFGFCPGAGEF